MSKVRRLLCDKKEWQRIHDGYPRKEMLAVGISWLIVLLQTGAALEYRELSTHSAQLGSNTKIPCKFDVAAMSPAERPFTILWHFQDKEIFRSSLKSPDPRLSIDQAGILDGIADLSMSGVSIGDGGLYACSMVHTSGRKVKEVRLDIYAPPKTTITNKPVFINTKSVLSCLISGFYPVDIDIKWLRNGDLLDNVTVERPQRNHDGTYDIRSSVTMIPTEEDRERIFSCKIQHESLNAPLQEDFQLIFEDSSSDTNVFIIVGPLLGVLVILTMIVGIYFWRKKLRRKGRKKGSENEADQNESLVSSIPSGAVQPQQDFISNKSEILPSHQQSKPQTNKEYEWLIRPGAPAIRTSSQTAQHSSEGEPQSQTSVCNKTQLLPSNQQQEPQENPKILKTSETPKQSSGAVRQKQDYPLMDLIAHAAILTSSQTSQHSSEDEPQSQTSVCNKTQLLPSNQQQEPQEDPKILKTSETPKQSSGAVRQKQDFISNKSEILPSHQQYEPQTHQKYALMNVPAVTPIRTSSQTSQHSSAQGQEPLNSEHSPKNMRSTNASNSVAAVETNSGQQWAKTEGLAQQTRRSPGHIESSIGRQQGAEQQAGTFLDSQHGEVGDTSQTQDWSRSKTLTSYRACEPLQEQNKLHMTTFTPIANYNASMAPRYNPRNQSLVKKGDVQTQ